MAFEDEVLSPVFILPIVLGARTLVVLAYDLGFAATFVGGAEVFLLSFVVAYVWGVARRAVRLRR